MGFNKIYLPTEADLKKKRRQLGPKAFNKWAANIDIMTGSPEAIQMVIKAARKA